MSPDLPRKLQELIDAKNFGSLATVMPDGSPHVAPVWVDYDGGDVIVNTDEGRQKMKNIRRDPRVAMDIYSLQNPYDMVALRGRVVDIKREGAREHIDKLSKKYTGHDIYQMHQPGERRVIVRIRPEWFSVRR